MATEEQAKYTRAAYRFTFVVDLHGSDAGDARTQAIQFASALAHVDTQKVAEIVNTRLMNVTCLNEANPVDTPLNVAELTKQLDAMAAMMTPGGGMAAGA